MAAQIRVAHDADLAEADRVLCAAFRRTATFRPHLDLHRRIAADQFWVADDAGQIVGTAGAVDYGDVAYVGLMAVDPLQQRQGLARRLIEHLLAHLDRRGCRVVLLDASESGAPLYEQFGFVDDSRARVLVLAADALPKPPAGALQVTTQAGLDELVALDAPAFGADRRKLLEALVSQYADRLLVARDEHGVLRGYLFARDPTLGPWVALDAEAAEALLAAGLQFTFLEGPQVLVPRSNDLSYELLRRWGFVEQRTLRHMRRGGTSPPGRSQHLFGQSSFTHG